MPHLGLDRQVRRYRLAELLELGKVFGFSPPGVGCVMITFGTLKDFSDPTIGFDRSLFAAVLYFKYSDIPYQSASMRGR